MNLILFSVTTFAVLDYFYRFMRFVSTDLAKIAKFLCFYSKSGLSFFKDIRNNGWVNAPDHLDEEAAATEESQPI